MPPQAIFGISVAFSFTAWGIVAAPYLWPELRDQPRAQALRPLLVLHSFRFIGLAFLVPGVVSPELSAAFAHPAAYGDLLAAVLACLHWLDCRPSWGSSWSGCSTYGELRTSSTLSIRAIRSGLYLVNWVRRFSYRPSLCRCS
jgi:hypothetical protein